MQAVSNPSRETIGSLLDFFEEKFQRRDFSSIISHLNTFVVLSSTETAIKWANWLVGKFSTSVDEGFNAIVHSPEFDDAQVELLFKLIYVEESDSDDDLDTRQMRAWTDKRPVLKGIVIDTVRKYLDRISQRPQLACS